MLMLFTTTLGKIVRKGLACLLCTMLVLLPLQKSWALPPGLRAGSKFFTKAEQVLIERVLSLQSVRKQLQFSKLLKPGQFGKVNFKKAVNSLIAITMFAGVFLFEMKAFAANEKTDVTTKLSDCSIRMKRSTFFVTGQDSLLPELSDGMEKAAETLKSKPDIYQKLQILVYSSPQHEPNVPLDLVQKRAEWIKTSLIQKGVPANILEAKGTVDSPSKSPSLSEIRFVLLAPPCSLSLFL